MATKDGVWLHANKQPEQVGPLVATWIEIALRNPWILSDREPTCAAEPPISADDFIEYDSPAEMAARMVEGNWNTGVAFFYHDQCWINQSMGGCEMLVIKQDKSFESVSAHRVAGEEWPDYECTKLHQPVQLIEAIDKASVAECVAWEYGKYLPASYDEDR